MQPTYKSCENHSPARILHDAADYLAAHGWIHGGMYDLFDDSATPPACAVGAIRVAVFGCPVHNDLDFDEYLVDRSILHQAAAVLATQKFLLALLPGERPTHPENSVMDRIAVWNDTDGRTSVDVIAVLRHAADQWRPSTETFAAVEDLVVAR
jgi:hypothetical protein